MVHRTPVRTATPQTIISRHAQPSEADLRSPRLSFHHLQLLSSATAAGHQAREVFLRIFEQVRRKYQFEVVGYVVMPEHFHILIAEPEKGNPSTVVQVLKQSVAHRLLKPSRKRRSNQPMLWRDDGTGQHRHFWQRRFDDFNVYSNQKRAEKLRYMQENPLNRGPVPSPELWRWSSSAPTFVTKPAS